MLSRKIAFVYFLFCLLLSGCFDLTAILFPTAKAVSVSLTLDKPAGRYDAIPTSIEITFPATVDMSTISSSDFSISDTCAVGTAAVSASNASSVTTVLLSSVGGCVNTETVTVTLSYDDVKMVDTDTKVTGTRVFTYTVDTAAPTVSATVGSVSGIATSNAYAFTSMPTSVIYTFSSDIDLASVDSSDFTIMNGSGTDCSVNPTIGTLTKNSSQHKVTVPITGSTCGDGESFIINFIADSASDSTRDSSSGAASPLTGPAADLDIEIIYYASGVSVLAVGDSTTTADGTYGIGVPIDIVVQFDQTVDVTGTPRLKLNITGGATRYATYTSGTGTDELTFRYTTVITDTAGDLDYFDTASLQLNGGTISRAGSNGGIAATRTLASPGAANSLGSNRNIIIDTDVPTITTSSPTGPTNTWGTEARDITFTFSKELDPSSLADTDLTITAGTCSGTPTVTATSLGGAGSNVVTFSLSSNTCADGEDYDLSLDPATVKDLSANDGAGSSRDIAVTTETSKPTAAVSAPSVAYVSSSGSVVYTVTYSGATSVTLADGDVNIAGASTDCVANVTGTGVTTRTITITACSDNGAVQIDLAAGTAINTYGNLADAVDESTITDFSADNTELPDPTLSLPTFGANSVYNVDTTNTFTLTFAGDDLGASAAIDSALTLNCDSGGGANPVSLTAVRTSATVATITPDEGSPDFVYNADCAIEGTNVPDSAGNLHTFAPIAFKVGRTLQATSGPSGSISLSSVDLGSVLFNFATNPATIISANVTLTCDSQDIDLTSLNLTVGDTDVLIDFDETDPDWLAFVGGESCQLAFTTSVQNSLEMPLAAPATFNFTTAP
jgi:large repetitive protein